MKPNKKKFLKSDKPLSRLRELNFRPPLGGDLHAII